MSRRKLRAALLPVATLALSISAINISMINAFVVQSFPQHHALSVALSSSTVSTSDATSVGASQQPSPPNVPNLADPASVSRRVFSNDKRPVILFDGVCNMCNSAVNLALDWDPKGRLRFSALQSNVGRALLQKNGRDADDISSIVLVSEDGAFVKSDAILKITEELRPSFLPSFLPVRPAAILGRAVIPKFLRDLIYDGVADNRYSIMGMRDECRIDDDGHFDDRFVNDNLASK